MFSKLKNRFSKEPEQSVALRVTVFVAMMVPLPALARVRPALWPHVILAAVGMAAGHWYSYKSRNNPSKLVRAVMFVGIHITVCWMFFGLASGAVVPQAQFAIFAQAITSFDLRYRSNLFNTLIHSLANLYVAATLSRTTELALYLIIFAGPALAAFYIGEKESGQKAANLSPTPAEAKPTKSSPAPMILFGFSFGAITLLAIFIIFLFTPRYSNRPIVPPFSISLPLKGGTSAEIINPGVPLVQVNGWSNGTSDYYYGFDTDLDLRYRGGLSNEVVMYVRSPSRSYWRSHSYDFYDGIRWKQRDTTLTNLEDRGVYFELPVPLGSPESQTKFGANREDGHRNLHSSPGVPRHIQEVFNTEETGPAENAAWKQGQQIVQTYNIVRDLPNLIFAAYRPAEVFLSTERVSLDRGDGIRLPEPLKAGMTYSVVSYRPDFNPDTLRQVNPGPYPPDIAYRYLQLPDNISGRVKHLAQTLASPYSNNFDKIDAINNHLLTEYPYNFFPPPHPPGAEVVDTFLFKDQEGICEQYVTSLVVMARSLGIPARLAAGYGSGLYNPVTSYYEVRYSDAHSWAEIYFPEYGWVPFDPTPGWTPQPYPTPAQNWLFSNNGQVFKQLTGLDLPLGAIASGGLAGLAFFAPFLVGSALLVGAVLLLIYLSRRLWQFRQNRNSHRYSSLSNQDKLRQTILNLYRQGERALPGKKYPRREAWETVHEYAGTVGSLPALNQLSSLAEIAAYRPADPTEKDVEQAKSALTELKQRINDEG